ncbi:trypsin-like peptidase domain-containing protein [Candidatus Minimicrobia vallesae]|uniref:Trypsin-like peptidase domain-containing protein n=1 Tax=Candidatus Minimicrobia vallesae TaxID=2841264 RepID=A0A8F1SB36_9BACT|nr:trypsin-like peptidase domain-containing protein [Candidatus Minimicrobia vallesae]QWQ31604.1 trypsin-like peptidase domain-containing protein [Candidatus Minimicrobia vallesae]
MQNSGKQKRLALWLVGGVVGAATLVSIIFLTSWITLQLANRLSQDVKHDGNSITVSDGDVSKVVDKVSPSVVSIVVSSEDSEKMGAGTGVIISADGYVLTNKHVVKNSQKIRVVTHNGDQFTDVSLVGVDPLNDIAFLKIKDAKKLPVAELGNSGTVKVGQKVVAIGNSLGQYQNTVSSGIISGKGRPVVASSDSRGSKTESLTDLLQTDAPINLGNSGGPLINMAGQVIGINTAIASDAQSIGFAIPINAVKGMVRGVISGKGVQKAYLGVRYASITPDIQSEYKLPVKSGAYINGGSESTIEKDGPADKAGIKSGDIITKAANKQRRQIERPVFLLHPRNPAVANRKSRKLQPFAKSARHYLRLDCQSLDKSRPQTSISLFSYSIRVEIYAQSESRRRYLEQDQPR